VITLPVGYGDGYHRAMSNRAEVCHRGVRLRQVGRVCMDQMMVHLGRGEAYNGDVVWLIGGEGPGAISVEALAGWAGTVPHEILTSINTRVPRSYARTH
jgi:alanine racemase